MKFATIVLLLLSSASLLACKPGDEAGAACTTSGDGFGRKDDCDAICVSWEVTCADGSLVTPNVCAGDYCHGGSCEAGFHCVKVDSFVENSRCLPVDICPSTTPKSVTPLNGE